MICYDVMRCDADGGLLMADVFVTFEALLKYFRSVIIVVYLFWVTFESLSKHLFAC